MGRGVTMINLFSIGGVGLFQIVTARLFARTQLATDVVVAPYGTVFVTFAVALAIGLVVYILNRR